MVQHAENIDEAGMRYSYDIFKELPGYNVNSNSVVASVLYSVGIDWTTSLPSDIRRSEVPLYGQLQYMNVDDAFFGTEGNDRIRGGVGDDDIYGKGGSDFLHGGDGDDFVQGSFGDDALYGSTGNDKLDGRVGTTMP